MENLTFDHITYDRVFFLNKNILLKYSCIDPVAWKNLLDKNIDYINNPIKIEELQENEKKLYYGYNSKIYLPYYKDYKTFFNEDFTKNFNTIDILKLFKKNLELIKDMHNKDVYHGDVFSKNLMINKYYDIKLIDLDMMIIDDYVSPENVFMYEQDYHNDIEYAKEKNIKEDKLGIIYMYMRYLLNGRFEGNLKDDLTALKLPKTIEQEIQSIMNGKSSIKKEYYLEDIIDDLIDKNYTAPVLQRRKGK